MLELMCLSFLSVKWDNTTFFIRRYVGTYFIITSVIKKLEQSQLNAPRRDVLVKERIEKGSKGKKVTFIEHHLCASPPLPPTALFLATPSGSICRFSDIPCFLWARDNPTLRLLPLSPLVPCCLSGYKLCSLDLLYHPRLGWVPAHPSPVLFPVGLLLYHVVLFLPLRVPKRLHPAQLCIPAAGLGVGYRPMVPQEGI